MITIIFKAVEKCNSNCIYCGVIKKHQNAIMQYDLLKEIFQKINDYLLKYPDEKICFTWHGGEVCLLGAKYFFKAIELLEKYCSATKDRITHLVQSNLTLINQEIIDAFKLLGMKTVGASYEFIPHIRGFGKNRDSIEYNRKFFEGVNLLEKNGMTWGVIYVVHKLSLQNPLEVFYMLTNLNVAGGAKMNKIYIYGEDTHNLAISGREYADFLGAILPAWWKHRERFAHLSPFSQFYESYMRQTNRMDCELAGQCSHRWLYIGPTGAASQCGRAGDFGILPYGNIQEQTFEELLNKPQRNDIKNRIDILQNGACKDCRFWKVCHGGCPLDAILINGALNTKAPHCDWIKPFLTEYFEPITGLVVSG
jgi:uncharacterized protein